MSTRREFIRKATMLSAGTGMLHMLPSSIARAMAIDPDAGTTFLDAEHIVFLMQENRSFDHTYGTLQGVRGYNDPRAIRVPGNKPVWFQSNNKGETFAPFRLDIKNTNATWMESLPHAWADQVDARNNGRYDRWLDTKPSHIEQYREMPLTLGFYTRQDIPFYYSLADAFTVCDHNFCSSLTGTTPNRLYFWTGSIRGNRNEDALARVWNSDADDKTLVNWTTFPERLEENGVSWKIYQNEITTKSGLKDKHDAWLGNFGDNAIEYFSQYQAGVPSSALSGHTKHIHDKAFTTNAADPNYRELTTLRYTDNGTQREVLVPKGDILFQFREDVKNNQLPTVSWLVAPQEFSDHPSSAWYGAWYISEVMDILTANPEVWKKTIFILTYDENDGYFDHVPPFVAPHPEKPATGKVSAGIDIAAEYVLSAAQQHSQEKDVRVSPIGLGYRVPMVIASPWSRGGWVNSQVFDHTSSLMFLEKFLSHKTGKKIGEPNISAWRRTICGDLTSAFRPYNSENLQKTLFLDRDDFIESIHKASFRNAPSNFVKVSDNQLKEAMAGKRILLPEQEKGIRDANNLPYELYADARVTGAKIDLTMKAGTSFFGNRSAGAPFTVYATSGYGEEDFRTWSYAVNAGDTISDGYEIDHFRDDHYHLEVYGPNGFYRNFKGPRNFSPVISVDYNKKNRKPVSLFINIEHSDKTALTFTVTDNSYGGGKQLVTIKPGGRRRIELDLHKQFGWYDFSVKAEGRGEFEWRYAGKVENGKDSKTDPLMGGTA